MGCLIFHGSGGGGKGLSANHVWAGHKISSQGGKLHSGNATKCGQAAPPKTAPSGSGVGPVLRGPWLPLPGACLGTRPERQGPQEMRDSKKKSTSSSAADGRTLVGKSKRNSPKKSSLRVGENRGVGNQWLLLPCCGHLLSGKEPQGTTFQYYR